MFVFLSLVLSIAILAAIYRYSQYTDLKTERKFQLICKLKALVPLLRQHRAITHYSLSFGQNKNEQLSMIHSKVDQLLNEIIATAHVDNKPMYRVLQNQLKQLSKTWKRSTVSRNQLVHGKLMRQVLMSIDDLFRLWLMDRDQEAAIEEYRDFWLGMIDALDCLTQFRVSVSTLDSNLGQQRSIHYSDMMYRKLNKLSLVCPQAVASPMYSTAVHRLEALIANPEPDMDRESLYQLTSEISEVIFSCYDSVLREMSVDSYLPINNAAMI
ncbi:hypothetical protein [Vibrio hippocampi]|uniref:Nitrate/nitrite sensing protein domain-containing protein n=1 Tax=Vibrio hippocampi TaxID=654686 RepID=A0ABM8ZG11_9VIBR|nr:hypothetical protein [Vibrio hippocampi]CAH0525384.1 hypothetical protein VHP8226_00948 [Vibrio hippocampi]